MSTRDEPPPELAQPLVQPFAQALRVEDPALLTGSQRFGADEPLAVDTVHAHFVRSPYAHARIEALDITAALELEGVHAVLTGDDVRSLSQPFIVGVKQPMEHWSLALDRVRYAGEPVAVVLASDRYLAEDGAELVVVDYEPLDPTVEPRAAARPDAPLLHPVVGSNVVHDRSFVYGDPATAIERAEHDLQFTVSYPRNTCTPIECFVVTATYEPSEQAYDIRSNFQGPFTLHPVMARALAVAGNRLRLRSNAASGGSFGVKQAVFPYLTALALAARKVGRPVHWVEDRLEHLLAATSATNRVVDVRVGFSAKGVLEGIELDQLEDCGGYLRAPEPATLYRMHGNLNGPYKVRDIGLRNRVVLTNKTPSGLNRGFGGPQLYFALESAMRRIAVTLGLDPLDVIRTNLIASEQMPYHSPSGALLDSGDYDALVRKTVHEGGLAELMAERSRARAGGDRYGIGFAAIIEPSVSNMGYITTLLTAEARERAGPKNGNISTATVSVDPSGSVTVSAASVPQGQGHRTVLAQVVARALGLLPADVRVVIDHDTALSAWSIASGNYSSRFAGAVAGAAHRAALRVRARVEELAAGVLNCSAADVAIENGRVFALGNRENEVSFGRIAALAHWSPGELPEHMEPGLRITEHWSMPELVAPNGADQVNSSGAYGFVFDFCAVVVDERSGQVRIRRYVTGHDAGVRLHPAMVDAQIRGGFAHGLGAALFEELRYNEDGQLETATLADYPIPTATEVPDPLIVHLDTPSPFTPLGAKGVGEGNSMSTPVCIANAVADALGLEQVELPLTPERVMGYLAQRDDLRSMKSVRTERDQ